MLDPTRRLIDNLMYVIGTVSCFPKILCILRLLQPVIKASENEFNLLTPIMEKKSKTLMQAIDFTNAKYGRNAVSIAQAGINNSWKMRREHSSKIDTASFDFLPKISV